MSGYALTPLPKTDIFNIWSYFATESENAADRVEQAIYDACAFLAEGHFARPFSPRSHRPHSALLNADTISQLHRCLPAGNNSAPDCRRASRQTKPTPHSESEAVITSRSPDCHLWWNRPLQPLLANGVGELNLPPQLETRNLKLETGPYCFSST